MLAKEITYEDFNGNEVTETHYFNMTTIEMAELTDKMGGKDYAERLGQMIENDDLSSMINVMADMILAAYGQKSEDGKRFIKNDQIRAEFKESIAFAELLDTLLGDPQAAKEFGAGIAPKNMKPAPDEEEVDVEGMTKGELLAFINKAAKK